MTDNPVIKLHLPASYLSKLLGENPEVLVQVTEHTTKQVADQVMRRLKTFDITAHATILLDQIISAATGQFRTRWAHNVSLSDKMKEAILFAAGEAVGKAVMSVEDRFKKDADALVKSVVDAAFARYEKNVTANIDELINARVKQAVQARLDAMAKLSGQG